jgi:hypothetical protein
MDCFTCRTIFRTIKEEEAVLAAHRPPHGLRKETAKSKDSYMALRYLLKDSEKATKLFESPSPESVVVAFGEGPDL